MADYVVLCSFKVKQHVRMTTPWRVSVSDTGNTCRFVLLLQYLIRGAKFYSDLGPSSKF